MVWARLALVSIRAHQFTRARIEIDQLRGTYPTARGMLGGKEGIYAQRLAQLLEEARHEPPRRRFRPWVPPVPRDNAIGGCRSQAAGSHAAAIRDRARWPENYRRRARILVGNALCFGAWTFPDAGSSSPSGARINRLQLAPGDLALGQPTTMFTFARAGDRREQGKVAAQAAPMVYLAGDSDRCLWASQWVSRQSATDPRDTARRVAEPGTVGQGKGSQPLVGLDLQRDGAVCFRQWPPDPRWTFAGPPRVSRAPEDGRRVLVAMTEQGVDRRISIACYQADSGRLLWRRALCAAPVARQGNRSWRHACKSRRSC